MGKPQFVISVGFELVFEAEGEVEVYSLAGPIIVVQKCIGIIFICFHFVQVLASARFRIPGDVVLPVSDLFASQEPARAILVVSPLGPDPRLHALLIETGGFGEIENVELDFVRFLVGATSNVLVQYLEVIPLIVPLRVQVILQPKIVLDIIDLGNFSKIAVFEPGIENKHILLLRNIYLKRRLREIPLCRKLGQVFKESSIPVVLKVSFANFLLEQGLDNILGFIFFE